MPASDNAVMLGPWGPTVSGAFWKHPLPDEFPNVHAQHTQIVIGFGVYINSLKVVPQRSDSRVDDNIAKIDLAPNEFIKEYTFGFSVPDAKYLSWIGFRTNNDTAYGPYGTRTPSEFSFTVTKGKPVGFFGWNEGPISSFGVQLAATDNVVMVGPWGPIEGQDWKHQLSNFHAQSTNIMISSGSLIRKITVEADPSESRDETTKISIGPDELIKDYFVYVESLSKRLSGLGFSTNKETKGIYGTVTTSVFPLTVTKGKLVGFFGYNEVPINSIGVMLVP